MIIQAVRCGLSMQGKMEGLNRKITGEKLPRIEMGIGIHSGEVVVGNIGSEARAKYGIVGTAVNITQRIQTAAEGGQVIVSEPVLRCAKECLTVVRTEEGNT